MYLEVRINKLIKTNQIERLFTFTTKPYLFIYEQEEGAVVYKIVYKNISEFVMAIQLDGAKLIDFIKINFKTDRKFNKPKPSYKLDDECNCLIIKANPQINIDLLADIFPEKIIFFYEMKEKEIFILEFEKNYFFKNVLGDGRKIIRGIELEAYYYMDYLDELFLF
ncbi:hypothetical protein TCON_0026 [Astathelohania contejeani]|uniref:Uncharacterized protein n=1 Tax=Astathelohania contejeani TaxID=164912 RepID=A0ABQ7I380_9MICR|nr:hypothetical protein TCON_0026 [Thelohania contejeani]